MKRLHDFVDRSLGEESTFLFHRLLLTARSSTITLLQLCAVSFAQ
jgi:hypothetical protein